MSYSGRSLSLLPFSTRLRDLKESLHAAIFCNIDNMDIGSSMTFLSNIDNDDYKADRPSSSPPIMEVSFFPFATDGTKTRGLVARCHSFLYIYFYFNRADIQFLYILLEDYRSCYPHCFRSKEGLLWRAEPIFEVVLAVQKADALLYEPRCTLNEPLCILTEPRCTLSEPRCTLTEPRCTLISATM